MFCMSEDNDTGNKLVFVFRPEVEVKFQLTVFIVQLDERLPLLLHAKYRRQADHSPDVYLGATVSTKLLAGTHPVAKLHVYVKVRLLCSDAFACH